MQNKNNFIVFFLKYKSTEKTPGNIEAPTKQNEQDQIDTAAAHQIHTYLQEVHKH